MLKVAHVIKCFNRGGAEVLLREAFENKITIDQTDSSIIILHKKHLELLPDLKTEKVEIFNLFSIYFLLEYLRLFRFLSKNKYHVIHTHLPVAGIIILSMKLLGLRTKVLYTEHNIISSYHKLVYILLGFMYKYFDGIVFISKIVQESAIKSKKGSWFYCCRLGEVIYNGINTEKFTPIANVKNTNKLIIGTIASMRRQKRLDRWVEIAKSINETYPDRFLFVMGGDGVEKVLVEELISKYNLLHVFSLPGAIVNTPKVFAEFDVFLMTSDYEGLGIALLEAMACGCVPVASNVGGIKNIAFEPFGLKYDINQKEEIVKFVGLLLNDNEKMNQFKRDARVYVSNDFSIERQLNSLLQFYQKVIQKYPYA